MKINLQNKLSTHFTFPYKVASASGTTQQDQKYTM